MKSEEWVKAEVEKLEQMRIQAAAHLNIVIGAIEAYSQVLIDEPKPEEGKPAEQPDGAAKQESPAPA